MNCVDCEEEGEVIPSTKTWDMGYDHAFWTGQPRLIPVCDMHWSKRDNYEPPDPDGEVFRGNEAAAFELERAWENKR